ncbi:hypothetical protein ASPZODRAFT_134078 [Penicilliopsis zonata CBS 506.65]|uniref:Apurinic-apyrimidinic endonuclease 1 n=1 Tax=Penicilliopsis zonata CBS 506.65 TaxID=1073090 RepID=A0A1L9SE77_9EURO|nr:hypothetical protein ASPZODRAFT_134078 [Penicilliopsis zonata CBS 506.65]OJJ45423.1 hypothetical protein ASPZODRAFT_134078 [Penicilliopsis zonata CBS 506.65]
MPRGSRNRAPGALSSEASLNAKHSSSPVSRGGAQKRNIDGAEGLSPRRSKRVKGKEEHIPHEDETDIKIEEDIEINTRKHTSLASKASQKRPSVKQEEEEEEFELKQEDGQAAKASVTEKTTRKRKSKEEAKAETMPLAARTQGLRMFVGAHVSAAKGVFNAVSNSTHIGGNAFALFLKSQRKWDNPPLQDDHRDQFRRFCHEQNYDASKYVLPHGSYLVNLAQEDKAKAKQAYDSFLDDLRRCESLGITLYNFHPGSANQSSLPDALARLAKALTNALSETSTVVPVLETMCGHGSTIGGFLSEFRDLLALIPSEHHPRIGICIDTCHSFAAGYDLASPVGFQSFLKEFDDLIGIKHLRALHLNDSKAPRGSRRDLHANIGTGFLGLRAFHNVMNEPRFEDIPMILETPIDRPEGSVTSTSKTVASAGCRHDNDEGDAGGESEVEVKKKGKKKPATAKPAMVSDPEIWAREIKLLESLIGMDPEGSEFKSLEAQLAEEGREMREKQQAQYEKKLEAEEKKRNKAVKGQKTLVDMMKPAAKKSKKKQELASDDELET